MQRGSSFVLFFAAGLLGAVLVACGPQKPAEGPASGEGAPSPGAEEPTPAPGPTATAGGDELARAKEALDRKDYAAAKSALEALAQKRPRDGDVFFFLGRACEGANDRAGAEKAYKEALKLRPDADAVAENLSALYTDMERFDDAAVVARAGLAKHPENPALSVNLGVALASKQDAAGSAKAFEDAERLAPNDPMILLTSAHWLGVEKQTEAALVKLRSARVKAGDKVSVLAAVGHEMRLLAGFADCVPTFDKAISVHDAGSSRVGAAELRTERALCKLGAKDKDGALADLQDAVAKEPSFAPAHFFLGGRLADLKRWNEVAAEYQKYLDLAPNGPLAKQAQDRLKIAKERGKH
jgi:tetratricopeptide (TPR) repeat protein